MNIGYGQNYSYGNYLKQLEEAKIVEKGTPEEKEILYNLQSEAHGLVGKEWNEFSLDETTDEGIIEAAILMAKYRILLSNISHREEKDCGKK